MQCFLHAQVVVVRASRVRSSSDRQSDSATASDDFADECGVYSPMLSPRRGNSGTGDHSRSASSAEVRLPLDHPLVKTTMLPHPDALLGIC